MIKKILHIKLHYQILIALGLAVLAGTWSGTDGALLGIRLYATYDFIGQLFLNGLKMLIVPLVVSSIIVGMMGIGSGEAVGRLGGKTLIYYATTSLFAILVGLLIVNLTTPGIIDGAPARQLIGLGDMPEHLAQHISSKSSGDLVAIFLRMVPANIIEAGAKGQMLGLIFFSLLFGFFLTRVKSKNGDTLRNFCQGVFDVMIDMTMFIMKFAPLGVFGLVAKVVATSGFEAFEPLAIFFGSVLLALAIHFFVTMFIILKLAGVKPSRHYKAMAPALLTAFSTSSSSATLPLTMECVEHRAGVSNRVSSFTLPLGATVNMDGTALYECVAAMFIAQVYGIDLSFATQFQIVLIALLTSIGVAGIPSASLVAISIILASIGLPAEAVGLILVVDRILDMCRTAVNVFSDSVAAVVIGRLEGEKEILQHSFIEK